MLLEQILDHGTLVASRLPMTVAELLAEGQRLVAESHAEAERAKYAEQAKVDQERKELVDYLAKKFGDELAATAINIVGEPAWVPYGRFVTLAFKPFGHALIRFVVGRANDGQFALGKFNRPEITFTIDHEFSECDGSPLATRAAYADSLEMAVAFCAEGESDYYRVASQIKAAPKQSTTAQTISDALKEARSFLFIEFMKDLAPSDKLRSIIFRLDDAMEFAQQS